jgi:hypothetical protein
VHFRPIDYPVHASEDQAGILILPALWADWCGVHGLASAVGTGSLAGLSIVTFRGPGSLMTPISPVTAAATPTASTLLPLEAKIAPRRINVALR